MATLRNEITIDAGEEEVWALLGDLRSTPEWIPGVVEATVDGETRLCRTAEGQEIRERITQHSDERRTWSYEQDVVPLPIEGSRGTLRVVPDGDHARVEWEAEFVAPDDVAAMVDGYYRQTLEALKRRVEHGRG